jgi:protein-tyrosine-phosphatase
MIHQLLAKKKKGELYLKSHGPHRMNSSCNEHSLELIRECQYENSNNQLDQISQS